MMTAEGKEPPALGKAASDLYKAQGIAGFYRGIEANVMRAMVLNGTKMACYDTIKGIIVDTNVVPAGLPTQFCSAFGAGQLQTPISSLHSHIFSLSSLLVSSLTPFLLFFLPPYSLLPPPSSLLPPPSRLLHGLHRGPLRHGAHQAHEPAA